VVGRGAAIAFAAYIIGAISEAVSSALLRRLTLRQSRRAAETLSDFVADTLASCIERIYEPTAQWLDAMEAEARVAGSRLERLDAPRTSGRIVALERWKLPLPIYDLHMALYDRVRRELDRIALRMVGDKSELYSTYDRIRAEAEFRAAVAIPAAFAAVMLGVRLGGKVASISVAMGGVFLAVALLVEAIFRQQRANDMIVDAIVLDRVKAPALEWLERLTEADLERKQAPRSGPAAPAPL
jgi:hypothetical protein